MSLSASAALIASALMLWDLPLPLALANPISHRAAFASYWRHQPKEATERFAPSLSCTATINDECSEQKSLSEDDESDLESVLQVRNELTALSKDLALDSPSGIFLSRELDKIKLRDAVACLEAIAPKPSVDNILGDWTLLATANLPSSNIRNRFNKNEKANKKGWFKQQAKLDNNGLNLNPIQKTIQKALSVTQRIRTDGTLESTGRINRVDNVIEVTPLDKLDSILSFDAPLTDLINAININPLQVTTLKIVLVHKAVVESASPILRTKISPTSTVVNVAGSSSFFSPEGEDVLGVNNLLGDFQSGTFDTPYVDEDVRVSRSSGPLFETLRVFVRQERRVREDSNSVNSPVVDTQNEEKDQGAAEADVSKK